MDVNDKKIELLKQKLLTSMSKSRLTTLADIIEKKNPCSLRIIEWFVSSYSRDNRVVYIHRGKPFDVYSSYKDEQMSSYNKKLFDMYRRMPKFVVKLDNGRSLTTTVAQLNFFQWMFKNKILDYIIDNHDKIKLDLDKSVPKSRKNKKKFFENVKVTRINITINFD